MIKFCFSLKPRFRQACLTTGVRYNHTKLAVLESRMSSNPEVIKPIEISKLQLSELVPVIRSGDAFSNSENDQESEVLQLSNQFDDLVENIRAQLGSTSGINSDDVDVEKLMKTMSCYISNSKDWEKYALADPSRNYTRNGVDDFNDKANLLVLVWNPGRGSLIHDHADAHCIMKVLKGSLVETIYRWPQLKESQSMQIERRTVFNENDVTYIHDRIGLHKILNEGSIPAVSLHLYTPPWAAKYGCYSFDEKTGKQIKVQLSNTYSNKGILNKKPADAV
ncbi:RmlC-like cupin domain-containing protein [Dipodascopsis uninucleata]